MQHWNGRFYHNGDGQRDAVSLHLLKVLRHSFAVRAWQHADIAPEVPFLAAASAAATDLPIQVTVYGHASVLMAVAGLHILMDPVWSERIGPFGLFGPRRKRQVKTPLGALPKIDLVLLSHDHYDHMDKPTLNYLQRRDQPRIITGLGNVRSLRPWPRLRRGDAPVTELDWWQSTRHGDAEITFVPAQHFSGRGLRFNRALWGGFVLNLGGRHIYFAGDTAYHAGLTALLEHFPTIDLAFLPIGCYEPSQHLRAKHMNPAEAVRLHEELRCRQSMAIHFASFQLSCESDLDQIHAFEAARAAAQVKPGTFILPQFEQTYALRL